MARVVFGGQLMRQVASSGATTEQYDVDASTLGAALDAAFAQFPAIKGYVVDEQGRIRKHVAVFVDNKLVDRKNLALAIAASSEIYVLQALSGG